MLGYLKKGFHILNNATKVAQKIFIVVAVLVTVINLFFYFMTKDQRVATYDPVLEQRKFIHELIDKPELQESDNGRMAAWFHRKFFCMTLGEACSDDFDPSPEDLNSSMVGKFSQMFTYVYANPPASGTLWVYGGLQNSGLIPNAHAQGIGFYALQPLAPIWKMFRDLSYMLLVLIVIVIGFMIMFRAQINAQTEIAITNVLPRIVVAMLLITFSFAIAGFLIDLMYVLMGLGASVINSNFPGGTGASGATYNIFAEQGSLYDGILKDPKIWGTGGALLSLVPFELQTILRAVLGGSTVLALRMYNEPINKFLKGDVTNNVSWIGGILGGIISHAAGQWLLGAITGIFFPYIISFIVFITGLLIFFRIFIMLLMTYIKILLSIIFAPIILLFEAIPGRSTFGFWFKGLFFNIMTFPIVAILLMVTGLIAKTSKFNWVDTIAGANVTDSATTSLWTPPFLYSVDAEGFMMLVAIGIMFIIPDIVAYIKKSFGVEDLPFNISPATFLQGGGVVASGISGLIMRSRAITREFGIYTDDKRFGGGFLNKALTSQNPMKNLTRSDINEDVASK